jgi:hypothetical protein
MFLLCCELVPHTRPLIRFFRWDDLEHWFSSALLRPACPLASQDSLELPANKDSLHCKLDFQGKLACLQIGPYTLWTRTFRLTWQFRILSVSAWLSLAFRTKVWDADAGAGDYSVWTFIPSWYFSASHLATWSLFLLFSFGLTHSTSYPAPLHTHNHLQRSAFRSHNNLSFRKTITIMLRLYLLK